MEAKKAQTEKADKSNYRTFIQYKYKKADEILSDFSEEMIIRFFYRRNASLPYDRTATSRVSTLLHLFYLSPIRVG